MKYTFFIILFLISMAIKAQENSSSLEWYTNLEQAQKKAKKKNLPILMYFTGSDWCAPCKSLKEDFFETPTFLTKASNVILVMIDYPRRIDIISEEQMEYNKGIILKYNKEKAFPLLVGLTQKGREIDRISGYGSLRDPSYHFKFLEKLIK